MNTTVASIDIHLENDRLRTKLDDYDKRLLQLPYCKISISL